MVPDVASHTLRWVEILLGGCLLWLGLFTTPDEQRRYQSKFETWWVQIERLRKQGLSPLTAFLVTILEKTDHLFTAVLGPHLFSWRALGASLALAVSSFFGVLAWDFSHRSFKPTWTGAGEAAAWVALALFFFAVGMLQPLRPRWWPLQLPLALVGAWLVVRVVYVNLVALSIVNSLSPLFSGGGMIHSMRLPKLMPDAGIVVASLATLAFLSDLLFVAVTRKLLRFAGEARSPALPITVLAANAGLAALLIGVPLMISHPSHWLWMRLLRWLPAAISSRSFEANVLSIFNYFDGIVALSFFFVASLAMLDRVISPLLSRLLQVCAAEHILEKRGALITAGATLAGLPNLAKVASLFH